MRAARLRSTASRPIPAGSSTSRRGCEAFAELERRFGAPLDRSCSSVAAEARAALERLDGSARPSSSGSRPPRRRPRSARPGARGGARRGPRRGGRRAVRRGRSRPSWPTWAWTEARLRRHDRAGRAGPARSRPGRCSMLAANPGLPAGPVADTRLGRRAVADRAGDPGGGARRGRAPACCCSTRSTPASAGARRGRSAGKLQRLAERRAGARASPTCRRSRAWPTPTSGSRRLHGRPDGDGDRAARRRRARRRAGPHAGRRGRPGDGAARPVALRTPPRRAWADAGPAAVRPWRSRMIQFPGRSLAGKAARV